MKLIYLFVLLLKCVDCFNFHIFNFNTVIRRSVDDSIINFININNINYFKIKESSKYLILKYDDSVNLNLKKDTQNIFDFPPFAINDDNYDKKDTQKIFDISPFLINNDNYDNYYRLFQTNNDNNNYYKMYETIKDNVKPIIIIYNKKILNTNVKYRYLYLIKNKTNYIFKYNYIYNNEYHKYLFDINATKISNYETNWDVTAKFNYDLKDLMEISKISIISWFIYNIDNNNIKNYFYKKYLLFQYLRLKL